MYNILKEFFNFVLERKKYYLFPILLLLLLFGAIIITGEGASVFTPFIYAIF